MNWSRPLSPRAALALVPMLLALHNLEEAATMPGYWEAFASQLPAAARELIGTLTLGHFYLVLALITVGPFFLLLAPSAGKPRSASTHLLLIVELIGALNAIPHLLRAWQLGGYTPGLVSALAIHLPFAWWLMRRAWREQWAKRLSWIWMVLVALAIHGPFLAFLFRLATWLF